MLFGLLLVMLSGCVDYSEELWLNKDGSGKVQMVIGALTSYENKEEINRYLNQPGISLISKSVYRKDNYTYYRLYFRFNSLEAFNNLNDQVSNADFFGRISLNKEDDGTITMKRRISLGGLTEGEDEIEQLILQLPQENLKWRYKMHLPWKIVKSNAASENIDFQANTVSWDYQASFLWNKTQTMTVTMQPPSPILAIVLILLALIIIIVTLFWWRRYLKKQVRRVSKQNSPQATEPADKD